MEHRLGVGQGIGTLINGNLGHGHRVVTVLRGVALGDHGVAGVLAHVAVRQIELRLWRAKGGTVTAVTHGAGHCPGIFVGAHRRQARRHHTQHRLAQAQLDRRGRAPDHTHCGTTTKVDHFGEINRQTQVFSGHGRHEHRSFVEVRAIDHQTVQVFGTQAGVAQRLRRQVGHLLKMEHSRRCGVLLGFVLRGADNRRMTFKTHVSPTRRLCA